MVSFFIRVYWFAYFIFSVALCAADTVVFLNNDTQFSALDSVIPEQIYVKKYVYTGAGDSDHIKRIMNVSDERVYSQEDIKKSLFYAFKTKKFESITLKFTAEESGYIIHAHFEGRRIFSRLVIEGTFIGKERYRNYYAMASGDTFDTELHNRSISALQKALRDEGYYAHIIDTIVHDPSTEFVTVYLKIILGKRYTIAQVSMQGDSADLQKKIIKKIALLRGHPYSKILLDYAMQELKLYLNNKGYHSHSIRCETIFVPEKKGVEVQFFVTYGPKTVIEFLGNTFFSSSKLCEIIQMFGAPEMLIPPAIIDEIKAIYIKKGFLDVDIHFTEEQDHLFFFITEGPRYTVTDVHIKGSDEKNNKKIESFFMQGLQKYYDAQEWDRYKELAVDWCLHNGFWDAVLTYAVQKKTDSRQCVLDIEVTLGMQRKLIGISVAFFEEVLQDPLFARYKNRAEPIPFSLYMLQEQQQWLYRYVQKKGLLYARIRPEFQETPQGIWLHWIIEGDREPVRFGKTIIIGNSPLKSSYILRECVFKEGDIWSKEALNGTIKNLRNLNIFESVSLYPCDFSEKSTIKDLYLKIVEDSRFEVRTRAGLLFVSRNFGIRGGFSYMAGGSLVWKNPTYRADLARIDIDMSRYKQGIRAVYIDPWFFDFPIKTEYKMFSNRYDQPFVIGSRDRLYRLAENGFLIGWSRNLYNWQTGLTVGTEWMRINKLSTKLARAIDFAPWLIDAWIPYFFAEPSFFLEYLDDKLQPTSGLMTMISAKAMIPYTLKEAFFFKVLIEQSFFIPLYKTVFAWRIRAGHLFNQQFSRIMPNERFYLGGAYSLRGYPPDLAPPLNLYNCNGCIHFVPLGGKSMVNMNFELRFPIYGSFSGVIFSDWGALAQNHPAELVAGVIGANGFGFRYNTAVGPLRFDIGWKWKEQIGECRYAWFLTLGNAF